MQPVNANFQWLSKVITVLHSWPQKMLVLPRDFWKMWMILFFLITLKFYPEVYWMNVEQYNLLLNMLGCNHWIPRVWSLSRLTPFLPCTHCHQEGEEWGPEHSEKNGLIHSGTLSPPTQHLLRSTWESMTLLIFFFSLPSPPLTLLIWLETREAIGWKGPLVL